MDWLDLIADQGTFKSLLLKREEKTHEKKKRKTHEKMLNITHYQRNANQNHNEVPLHVSGWLLSKSLQAINAGEGVEKREPSYTVGGNAN